MSMSRSKRVIRSDGRMFNSVSDAAKEIEKHRDTPVSSNVISRCCRGLRESAYGYRWKFSDYQGADYPVRGGSEVFKSARDAAEKYGGMMALVEISKCLRGVQDLAFGVEWEYVVEDFDDCDGSDAEGPVGKSWPFADMDVGDDVLTTHRGQAYCHVYGRHVGKKFKTRKQPCGGVRVWRIA